MSRRWPRTIVVRLTEIEYDDLECAVAEGRKVMIGDGRGFMASGARRAITKIYVASVQA